MGRRKRKNEGLIELLVVLPWWANIGLGVVAFVVFRWVAPAVLPPLFKSLAFTFQLLAWLALALCSLLGVMSLARSPRGAQRASPAGIVAAPRSSSPFGHAECSEEMRPRSSHAVPVKSSHGSGAPESEERGTTAIDTWTIEALRELEWKRFELLCAGYYEAVGFRSETIRQGADGGIDVKLFKIDPAKPVAIVQCKAWNSALVGVKEVRELLGVMVHEKVGRGIFITTGGYTKDAMEFGKANPIQLLDGAAFVKKLRELAKDKQADLLTFAFAGDYSTPTCASCGIKMMKREGKRGAFWGCLNYPKCRSTFASM